MAQKASELIKGTTYRISVTAVYSGDGEIDPDAMSDRLFAAMSGMDKSLLAMRVESVKPLKSMPKAMQADIEAAAGDIRKKAESNGKDAK